jgi:PAS domain S-box-containing protein
MGIDHFTRALDGTFISRAGHCVIGMDGRLLSTSGGGCEEAAAQLAEVLGDRSTPDREMPWEVRLSPGQGAWAVAHHRVLDHPAWVALTLPTAEVFAQTHRQAVFWGVLTAAVFLAAVAALVLQLRHVYGLDRETGKLQAALATADREAGQRAEAQQALRDSERRTRQLYEAIHTGVAVLDRTGRIIQANPVAKAMFAAPLGEITGRHPTDPVWNMVDEQGRPVDGAGHPSMITLETGEPVRNVVRGLALSPDEPIRWLLINTEPLKDDTGAVEEVIVTFNDITVLKQAQEDHRRVSERLTNILNSISDGFFSLNEQMVITFYNRAAERLLGLPRSKALGRHFHDAFPEARGSVFDRNYQAALADRKPMAFETYFGQEPYVNWYDVRVFPFEEGISIYFRVTTAQRQAQQRLRKSQQLLAETGALARVGGWEVDVVASQLTWTETTRQLHEVDEKYQPQLDTAIDFYHPDDRPMIRRAVTRAMEQAQPFDLELRLITAGGRQLWVRATGQAEQEAGRVVRLHGAFQDITERKEAELALRQREEQLDLAVKGGDLGLWDHDLVSGRITTNARALDMLGADEASFGGTFTWWLEQIHPEDRDAMVSAWEDHLAGQREQLEIELRVRRSDGEYVWLLDRGRVVQRDEQGRPLRASGTLLDITGRKQAEQEQQDLQRQIEHAQKLESLGVLAGGIAHDFNNLLVGVLGNADLALRELSPVSPARENVTEIERAARRAADLCRQMLAYSGKGRFVVEPVELPDLIEEMAHMLEVSIGKGVVLKYHFGRDIPPIEADATQLRQVVMNLIINASEAIGDRSGVISVTVNHTECDREYLSSTYLAEELEPGTYVVLEVADTGVGMDKQTLDRLFEPFFTTKFTGRGLGLAAVQGIVRGHQGAVKVYSEPGQGTTFRVLLPAAPSAAPAKSDDDDKPVVHVGSGRVLLADDEPAVLKVGGRMLERLGYEVVLAPDGREALELYQQYDGGFRCVILDLTMPHIDGEQAFRQLRQVDPDVRVVISSGYNEQEVTQRFIGRGLAGFIQKPYTMENLAEALEQIE